MQAGRQKGGFSRIARGAYVGLLAAAALALPSAPRAATGESAVGAIRGRAVDARTLRPVAEAAVSVSGGDGADRRAATGADGRYSVEGLAEGLYRVVVEGRGYLPAIEADVRVVKRKVTVADFELVQGDEFRETVLVTARGAADNPRDPVTAVRLGREEIRRSPGTAGDVFRSLDTLPGVAATGEFSSFTVRGRGPRDNLILVDDIPFDKVVHFDQTLGEEEDIGGGGRFSIFVPNLIGGAEFRPGGWGAAYGGKNGSLLRLEVAEGNPETPSFSGRLDVTGPELNYDGPSFLADGTSVIVSARHREFERLFETIDERDIGAPTLTDVILKTVSSFGPRHRLELLAIHAPESFRRDVENVLASPDFQDTAVVESDQDSDLLGVTWRWLPGASTLVKNVLFVRESDKTSSQGEAFPDQAGPDPTPATTPVRPRILTIEEGERELGWRGDVTRVTRSGGTLAAGARLTRVALDSGVRLDGDWVRYVFDQDDFRPDPDQQYVVLTPARVDSRVDASATRGAAYAEYSFRRGILTLTPGLRYDYDGFSGESLWSPRMAASWQTGPRTRLSAAAGLYYQAPRFLELAADPANARLGQERSTQLVLGVSRLYRDDLRLSAELYYQALDDLVVAGDRTEGIATNSGRGETAGLDLTLAKRMTRKWFGSATYSFSRSKRDDRRGEGEYDADFHRPHVFAILGSWELNPRWALSAKWKFAAGRPTDAFVVHADVFDDPDFLRFSKEITRQNVERLPDFHTLNVRADYRRRFGRVSLIAFIDFINLYDRKNVDSLEWDERRGVNVMEGLEAFPNFGLKFEL